MVDPDAGSRVQVFLVSVQVRSLVVRASVPIRDPRDSRVPYRGARVPAGSETSARMKQMKSFMQVLMHRACQAGHDLHDVPWVAAKRH